MDTEIFADDMVGLAKECGISEETAKTIVQYYVDGEIGTDSDIYEFCQENQCGQLEIWVFLLILKYPNNRNCIKCSNVRFAFNFFPCTCCTRNPHIRDYFN